MAKKKNSQRKMMKRKGLDASERMKGKQGFTIQVNFSLSYGDSM